MVDASVVVSIVIAVISFLSTIAVALIGVLESQKRRKAEKEARVENNNAQEWLTVRTLNLEQEAKRRTEEREEKKAIATLIGKYSPPLMLAAYELQARLYELLEYPISREHLETVEGLEDIKIFTCHRFAQFLAWTYILETKTQYFAFTDDPKLKNIGDMILRLNEEFDRRRNRDGENIGVWPGPRLLVSARMIRDDMKEKDVSLDMIVKNYDTFHREWDSKFRGPMSYFCHWIDWLVHARLERVHHEDDAMRCTQHNLVALIIKLDTGGCKNQSLPCHPINETPYWCDCGVCEWTDGDDKLKYRKESRNNDKGLEPWYKKETISHADKQALNLESFNQYTDTERFNPWRHGRKIEGGSAKNRVIRKFVEKFDKNDV